MSETGYNSAFTYNSNPTVYSYYDVANFSLGVDSNPYLTHNNSWTNLLNGGSGGINYFSNYTSNNVVDFTPTNGSFIINKKGIYKISMIFSLNRTDINSQDVIPIKIRLLNGTSNYPDFINITASGTSPNVATNTVRVDTGSSSTNVYYMNPNIRTDTTDSFQYAQYYLSSSAVETDVSGNYCLFDQICSFRGTINVDSDNYIIYPQIYVVYSTSYKIYANTAVDFFTKPRIMVEMMSNVAVV